MVKKAEHLWQTLTAHRSASFLTWRCNLSSCELDHVEKREGIFVKLLTELRADLFHVFMKR